MSWEHDIAKQIKKRDNPALPVYLEGMVASAEPLVISVFGGQVMLREGQLRRVDPLMLWSPWETCPRGVKGDGTCGACGSGKCIEPRPLEVGQKVALVGQQTYFILLIW